MNKTFNRIVLLSFVGIPVAGGQAPVGAMAPVDTITPVTLEPKAGPAKNRFDMSFRSSLNMSSQFKHVGAFPAPTDPGPASGLANHFYDDGYNLVDSTGNQHFNGTGFTQGTWNWGYHNFSQVNNNGDVNGTLEMHSDSSTGGISSGNDDGPHPGFEMNYSRELYRGDHFRAGVEGAFNYTDVEIKDTRGANISVTRLTDSYSLNGTTVPTQDDYGQDINGDPNHIILSDTPNRSFSTMSAPVSGSRDFGADIFGFKAGPYVEIPIGQKVSLTFDTGVTMVYVYSKFSFDETIVTPDRGVVNVHGSGENQGFLFGGYVGGRVNLALNDQWSAFAGAQWQDVGVYTHRAHLTREAAALDLSNMISVNVGLGYTF